MKLNTIPNWITLTRFIFFIFILTCLVFSITPLKPIILPLYIIVFLMDKLDGFIARKYHMESDFGKFFDLSTDRAIVTSMLICYLYFFPSKILFILISINLIRDFFVAGLRQLAAIKEIFLKAHILGKLKFITENLSAIMVVIACSYNLSLYTKNLLHVAIIWVLVIGSICGWLGFVHYFKQILNIKK